jgi:hypothetical protein
MAEQTIRLTPLPKEYQVSFDATSRLHGIRRNKIIHQKNTRRALIPPADFMVSVETISSLKRKTRFPSITTAHAKRFRLDPSLIPEDVSIDHYYNRINEVLPGDRPKIQVMIPFEKMWDGVLERQDKQSSIISGLVASGEEMKTVISEMRTTMSEMRTNIDECA